MLEAGLVLSRILHFGAVLALFGGALFPLYTYPSHVDPPAWLGRWLQVTLFSAASAALLSGVLWFLFTAANMAGDLSGATDRDALWSVATATSFGEIWVARLALAIIILGMLAVRPLIRLRHSDWPLAILSAALLASLAGVGHTQSHEGLARIIHMGGDGAHLLAAGAWLGALPPLFHLVSTPGRTAMPEWCTAAGNALLQFSGAGQLAVATLIGSGLINGWYLVGSFDLISTVYGQLLFAKLGLFAGMLLLAAMNRFWLVPSLIRKDKSDDAAVLVRLRGHIVAEQALAALIIVIVSVLGIIEPASNFSTH
jgi:putative copper resistance protein D